MIEEEFRQRQLDWELRRENNMLKKQSSSRISTIAGRVLKKLSKGEHGSATVRGWHYITVADVKALAASCLSQDEQPKKRVTTFWIRPGRDFGWKIFEGRAEIGFSQLKKNAVTLAKQQAARQRPSRVVLHMGKDKKILKEYA